MSTAVQTTEIPGLPLFRRGKVRDVYDLGSELLMVATDRISAFDVVLPTPIPDKGRLLNQLSRFWFELLGDAVPNHVLAADVEDFPRRLQPYRELLSGRSMLVRKTAPLPVECIVRGYLAGSGLKDYRATGGVCGVALPAGLVEASPLRTPIFTPSTKAETGHDENMSFEELTSRLGSDVAGELRETSLRLYERARAHAESRGLLLADTKLEFGLLDGRLVWIDEAFTPDSSRFWPRDDYAPGRAQASFDKQFVRDYLESVGWNKVPPAPVLPPDVVARTRERYLEAVRRLTGGGFEES